MNKEQVFELLSFLDSFYNQGMSQNKLNAWHTVLKETEFEVAMNNAREYIKKNTYFPKPVDIIKPVEEVKTNIPDVEETKRMLDERSSVEVATEEQRAKHKQEIEKILRAMK